MNKRGQVLVLFILLIPIFLMLMAFIIDIGLLYLEDKHIESSISETIEYGLSNIEEIDIKYKMTDLLTKNIKDISSMSVDTSDGSIYIKVKKEYNGIFKSIFKNNIYIISNDYYGYKDNDKFIISKE